MFRHQFQYITSPTLNLYTEAKLAKLEILCFITNFFVEFPTVNSLIINDILETDVSDYLLIQI